MQKLIINICKTFLLLSIFISSSYADDRYDRIKEVFNDLNAKNMHILDSFYHENVKFLDPLGGHNGLSEIKAYYENLYKNVTHITFKFSGVAQNQDEYFVAWLMEMKTKKLNDGKMMTLHGTSHIKFDPSSDLVIYHRDYFDMHEFVYQYIWGVKWVTKKVNDSLKLKKE